MTQAAGSGEGAEKTYGLGDLPSPVHRRALEVVAQAYVTRESLLRAVLGDQDAARVFPWLRLDNGITVACHNKIDVVLVTCDDEEPLPVAPHVFVQRGRHLEPLQALGALTLAHEDVAPRVGRERAARAANLLVDLAQERAALADDLDLGPPPRCGTYVYHKDRLVCLSIHSQSWLLRSRPSARPRASGS